MTRSSCVTACRSRYATTVGPAGAGPPSTSTCWPLGMLRRIASPWPTGIRWAIMGNGATARLAEPRVRAASRHVTSSQARGRDAGRAARRPRAPRRSPEMPDGCGRCFAVTESPLPQPHLVGPSLHTIRHRARPCKGISTPRCPLGPWHAAQGLAKARLMYTLSVAGVIFDSPQRPHPPKYKNRSFTDVHPLLPQGCGRRGQTKPALRAGFVGIEGDRQQQGKSSPLYNRPVSDIALLPLRQPIDSIA